MAGETNVTRHHLIISGTGRAGTTFLVQLLTKLGLDTGLTDPGAEIFSNCNAGMELDIREPDAPYIIKSPWLCDDLDEILETGDVVVDHAIIPVRDLYAAAESRRDVVRRTDPATLAPDTIAGGLWHTVEPSQQEAILTLQLYKLLVALAKHSTPTTFIWFPRLVHDPEYLFERLRCVLADINYPTFEAAFRAVSRPELVHDFGSG